MPEYSENLKQMVSQPSRKPVAESKQGGIGVDIGEGMRAILGAPRKYLINPAIAAAETATTLATGMASSIPAGLSGLGKLATGGSLDEASAEIQRVQRLGTILPKSNLGQLLLTKTGEALSKIPNAGDAAFEFFGNSPAAGTAGTFLDPTSLIPGLKVAGVAGIMAGKRGMARLPTLTEEGKFVSKDFGERYEFNPPTALVEKAKSGELDKRIKQLYDKKENLYKEKDKILDSLPEDIYTKSFDLDPKKVPKDKMDRINQIYDELDKVTDVKVRDVISEEDFPELAQAYPELFDMPFNPYNRDTNVGASYLPTETGSISFNINKNKDQTTLEALMHELQHGVQDQETGVLRKDRTFSRDVAREKARVKAAGGNTARDTSYEKEAYSSGLRDAYPELRTLPRETEQAAAYIPRIWKDKKVGDTMSSNNWDNLCIGTSNRSVENLKKTYPQNTSIKSKYLITANPTDPKGPAIDHYTAYIEIDGRPYLFDKPQIEMVRPKSNQSYEIVDPEFNPRLIPFTPEALVKEYGMDELMALTNTESVLKHSPKVSALLEEVIPNIKTPLLKSKLVKILNNKEDVPFYIVSSLLYNKQITKQEAQRFTGMAAMK